MAYLTRSGRNRRYMVRFRLGGRGGRQVTIPAFPIRTKSEDLLRRVQELIACRAGGLELSAELRDWAARLSPDRRQRLVDAELLDVDDRGMTLDAFRARFLAGGVGTRGTPIGAGQREHYDRMLGRLSDFTPPGRDQRLGDVPLREITAADILAYLDHAKAQPGLTTDAAGRRRSVSVSHINLVKRTLRSAFEAAIRLYGVLDVNPMVHISQARIPDKRQRYVGPTEFRRFLAAIDRLPDSAWSDERLDGYRSVTGSRQWWRAFVLVMYVGGLRIDEALHLTWLDVDFEGGRLTVIGKAETANLIAWQPKSKRRRVIPVDGATLASMADLQGISPDGSPYAFLTPRRRAQIRRRIAAGTWNERRPTVNNLDVRWSALLKAAAVERFTRHDLRRSCITNWAMRLPMRVTMEMAGHVSINTTEAYYLGLPDSHQDDVRRAAEDVARQIREPTTK